MLLLSEYAAGGKWRSGSHGTSIHSMDNRTTTLRKLIPQIAEGGVNVVANPLFNIKLQGRHDTFAKRHGRTCVPFRCGNFLALKHE